MRDNCLFRYHELEFSSVNTALGDGFVNLFLSSLVNIMTVRVLVNKILPRDKHGRSMAVAFTARTSRPVYLST
jgi:hypothetical protein